jgi:hypothetical protein
MVGMLVALIAVVVVVAGAVVAKLTWRPSHDEVHSVNDYHSALGTIGELASRNPPPGTHGRSPTRGGRPDPAAPLVFDDDRPTGPTPKAVPAEDAPIFRSDRARRQALSSMNHRPRRWVVATAAVVVLLAFGALAYVGSHRNNKSPAKSSSSAVTHTTAAVRTTPTTHPPTQVRTTPTTHPPAQVHTTKPKPKPKSTTPTTAPQIAAITTSATSATYPVPSSSYQLVVTTSTGPCWIQAQSTNSGTTLWEGTIPAGSSQTIPGNGGMTIDIGASGTSITVNGVPVGLPAPLNVPFQATFTSSSTTTPGASTSPSSSSTANTG